MLEINKIYNENCLTGMQKIDDDSIDIIITSPPYNVGMEYEKCLSEISYYKFLLNIFIQIKRVLKNDGRICWNVPYQMYTKRMSHKISQWYLSTKALLESGLNLRDNITWNQNYSDNDTAWGSWRSASAPWLRHQTEAIIIAYNKQWKKLNKGESTITRDEFLKYVIDIWSMPVAKRIGHPAPFPIELPLRCLKLFSYKNDIVLDPFIGSGTTAIACHRTGRNFIGFENNKTYFELANKLIGYEQMQIKLDF